MIQDMKLFAKTHRNALIVNAVMVCICYLHMAFSQNVGIDTERIIVAEGPLLDSWKTVGRQGLLLSKMLGMPGGYNPYLSGMIFLLGFILLGALIAFLCWTASGRDDRYPYGLFMALFAVCSVWMPQFYFALQRAEVVLGMIYAVISVFALSRLIYDKCGKGRMVFRAVLGLAFGVWSFCTYQGCVAFYIGLCIMVFLMDFAESYREKEWWEYAWAILKLIGGFAVVYVVNMAITKMFFRSGAVFAGADCLGAGIYIRYYTQYFTPCEERPLLGKCSIPLRLPAYVHLSGNCVDCFLLQAGAQNIHKSCIYPRACRFAADAFSADNLYGQ